MLEPLVSVIIPTYNRAEKILPAIESVLSQSWKNLELLIVDDGSKDNTRERIEAIDDSRVRYIYQNNAGACAARNNGIWHAKGEYIAFHDSDDLWRPEKLRLQMEALMESQADIVFCKLVRHSNDGSTELKPDYATQGFLSPVKNLFGIGTQTLVAKRKVFEEFQFNEIFPRFQEFELLYRASEKYSIYCVNQGLVDYYVGEDSISSNPEKLYTACELFLKIHPEMPEKYPKMGARMVQNLLSGSIMARKNKDDYKKYLVLARKCHGGAKLRLKALLIRIGFYGK